MAMTKLGLCAVIALAGVAVSASADAACSVPPLDNSLVLSSTYSHASSYDGNFRASDAGRPNTNTSEDTQLQPLYCGLDTFGDLWDHYNFDEENWNDNRGVSDGCNPQLMLGRTMAGLAVLNFSSPTPATNWDDMSGNALRWGGNFAAANIDELDGVCSFPADGTWATTHTGGIFVDEWTRLYKGFAYQLTPYYRAGTIIHEARQAHGESHDGNDGGNACPAMRGSCDEDYSDTSSARANSYESWFAQWYLFESVNSTTTQKRSAQRTNNWNLSNRFDNRPGFVMQANSARQTCNAASAGNRACRTAVPNTVI
jgi:hypothetical protein